MERLKNASIAILAAHITAAFWIVLLSPQEIGAWRAQYEIGLDQIWQEYIADCDCTAAIE